MDLGDGISATDLARAWEGIPELRRRAQLHQLASSLYLWGPFEFTTEVRVDDSGVVTRNTLTDNEVLVTVTLSHVGTRVGIKTLEVHLGSLYDLMRITVPGSLRAQ